MQPENSSFLFAPSQSGQSSETILHLQTMLTLSRYSCAMIDMERKLSKGFNRVEEIYFLRKLAAFTKLQDYGESVLKRKVMKEVQTKLQKVNKLFLTKCLNYKVTAFYDIANFSSKQRLLRKYELSESDSNDIVDSNLLDKQKQLDMLIKKYHRLRAQFGILTQRVDKYKDKKK